MSDADAKNYRALNIAIQSSLNQILPKVHIPLPAKSKSTTGPRPTFNNLLEFAHELADLSAAAINPHFRKRLAVDNKAGKGAFDPVTVADRAAERVIRKALAATWPDHCVIGEEFEDVVGDSHYSWVLDPIDGTRSFIMGYPTWGTLIGLLDGNEPVLGIMNQPFTAERYWTSAKASFVSVAAGRARRLNTRDCTKLSDAILTTTDPRLFARGFEANAFAAIQDKCTMTRYGGDCYGYCMLAAGHVDIVVEAGLHSFDVMALIPIVERAGGVMTTWDGSSAINGGRILAAATPRLHKQAMKILKH